MKRNVINKSRSDTSFIKKLKKIKNQQEFEDFFKDKDMSTLPFSYNPAFGTYTNVVFQALLSQNTFVLEKLLGLFPDSLKEDLFIIEQTKPFSKAYTFFEDEFKQAENDLLRSFTIQEIISWTNINKKMDSELILMLNSSLCNESILFTLYNHNLLEKEVFSYLTETDNENYYKGYTSRFEIYEAITDFYFDNKLSFKENNPDIFYYKHLYDKMKYSYQKLDESSYLKEKEKYAFYKKGKEADFFNDKDVFHSFFMKFDTFYFTDLFKEKNIDSYSRGFDKEGNYNNNIKNEGFKNFDKHESLNIRYFLSNNHSVSFFQYIEPFINKKKHFLYDKDLIEYYDNAFSSEKTDFSEFYSLLNKEYGYSIDPELIGIANMKNLQCVIELSTKKVTGEHLKNIINTACKNKNYGLFKKLAYFKNVDTQNVFNEFVKNAIILNRKSEHTHIENLIDFVKDNPDISVKIELLNMKTTVRNEVSSKIEKYLLNSIINNPTVELTMKNKRL